MYEVEQGLVGIQRYGPLEMEIADEICIESNVLDNVDVGDEAGWVAGVKTFWADKGVEVE